MLEKTAKMNMLYDFYQTLLTDKQREYMELYYYEDYSLGEIATETNVSRQAIYDNIKRTEQILMNYEEKLQLYEKFLQREALLVKLEAQLTEANVAQLQSYIQQIKNID
ncbi:putative DNA-binding protein [Pseudogracilibacillus sp. ICA-222130]|uniref:putative DNA-binding protein n=1 Tax=Pseudogracilibacillus sp. ICA-222130 TaxID=3134655 RepID=UPI0030BBCFED